MCIPVKEGWGGGGGLAPPSIVAQFSDVVIRPIDVVVFSILPPLFALSFGRSTDTLWVLASTCAL